MPAKSQPLFTDDKLLQLAAVNHKDTAKTLQILDNSSPNPSAISIPLINFLDTTNTIILVISKSLTNVSVKAFNEK